MSVDTVARVFTVDGGPAGRASSAGLLWPQCIYFVRQAGEAGIAQRGVALLDQLHDLLHLLGHAVARALIGGQDIVVNAPSQLCHALDAVR